MCCLGNHFKSPISRRQLSFFSTRYYISHLIFLFSATMTSPHITLLPLELVHKIASFCPINDLVALGDTCRHLHSTCNDSFVLQEAFFCHVADKTTLRKLLVDRLSFESPAEARAIWRRLAAATSQLPRLINELETHLLPYESVPWDNSKPRPGLVAPQVRDIIGTLSTLTVLGRMLTCP